MNPRTEAQGFLSEEGRLKATAFRRKLEEDPLEKYTMELQAKKPPPKTQKDATEKIPPPPAGYERPKTWIQVAQASAVLVATHEGWEPCAHELEAKRDKQGKLFCAGPTGLIHWRGNRLEGVSLKSLRVPGAGDRELRHG